MRTTGIVMEIELGGRTRKIVYDADGSQLRIPCTLDEAKVLGEIIEKVAANLGAEQPEDTTLPSANNAVAELRQQVSQGNVPKNGAVVSKRTVATHRKP